VHDFVHDVPDKSFTVLWIGVRLDHLSNQGTSFNSEIHQIKEEVQVRQEMPLAIWVLVGYGEQKLDNLLE